jgi:hypothetical protein
MEFFSVHFEPDSAGQTECKLVGELKKLGAIPVLEWLWVMHKNQKCDELDGHLRRFGKAKNLVVEKISRALYRSLLHMAGQARKKPSRLSTLEALVSLTHRRLPK